MDQLTHDDYEDMAERWARARTVLAGEDAVKAAGTTYLPKLEAQEDGEYSDYKSRAQFFGATGRTLDGLNGMIFRRDPKVTLEDKAEFEPLEDDVDMRGSTIGDYADNASREVLAVGRAGTLVDFSDEEKRSSFVMYKAEEIWNWREERIGGRMTLTMVALHECVTSAGEVRPRRKGLKKIDGIETDTVEQLRILKLALVGTRRVYQVDRYVLVETDKGKEEWVFSETLVPTRRGEPLGFIPFVFHSPKAKDSDYGCCKPPLEDIITINIHHYRVSADYNHALHFVACPTAWVAGFPAETKLRIGSSVAWVSPNVDASAGYLEFKGQGLQSIVTALEKDERYMAILGARLLEEQKREAETAEAMRLRQGGEGSVLSNVAKNLSSTLTKALKICVWWIGFEASPADVEDERCRIELNTDFVLTKMTSEELTALVAAWQSGAISRDTMWHNLRMGELLPDKRSNEEEADLIETDAEVLFKMRQDEAKATSAGAGAAA